MTRIGILGINDLTETFLVELFRLDPYVHVFLSAGDMERANRLARKFPCWILDTGQAVVDEVDTVLITQEIVRPGNVQENIEYRQTQLVLLFEIIPSFDNHDNSSGTERFINRHVTLQNLSPCLHLSDEHINNYLFVLRAQLMTMKLI
ncbi:MAG: hypothetical protein H6R25_1655 [Proteobacteria bacterium]|nr:hypothetical protein [Pseudomonadota bacterium]